MMSDAKPQTGREHEVGTLAAPLLTLDLKREIEKLRSEGRWQSGHTAKTLVKYSDFRRAIGQTSNRGTNFGSNSRRTNSVQYCRAVS